MPSEKRRMMEGDVQTASHSNSKKYGLHTAINCPYTTPDCVPRAKSHTPITVLNGVQAPYFKESDPATVKQFTDARKLLLSTASTSSPAVPKEPERTRTMFPMLCSGEEDAEAEDIVIQILYELRVPGPHLFDVLRGHQN